jgi:hypothetical protein
MKQISPVWIAVAVAALLAAAAIAYNTWGAKKANPTGVPKAEYRPPRAPERRTAEGRRILGDVEITGPTIVRRDAKGNELWSAQTAGALEVSDEAQRVKASGVEWNLTRGKDKITLKSELMEVGWSGGDVTFGGGIDIRTNQGRRFLAREARFQTGTEKIVCEGGVSWQAGRYDASADKLVIDVRNRKLRLRGHVKLVART